MINPLNKYLNKQNNNRIKSINNNSIIKNSEGERLAIKIKSDMEELIQHIKSTKNDSIIHKIIHHEETGIYNYVITHRHVPGPGGYIINPVLICIKGEEMSVNKPQYEAESETIITSKDYEKIMEVLITVISETY